MKKFMVMAAGLMMAAVLGACAPTARNTGETSEHGTAPAGAAQQETVDGVAEKESMVGNGCRSDGNGLRIFCKI